MKNILKFGEFIKENLLLEGREHSFADKVVRAAQPLLSDDEQESDNLYEKILSWAISYYDINIFGRNATDEDTINCLNSIKPKIEEWRVKQKARQKARRNQRMTMMKMTKIFKKLKGWNTYCYFKELSKNKGVEVQFTFEKDFCSLFKIDIDIRTKCDHAGVRYSIELFKYVYFHIYYYDFRHWDEDKDAFCIYDQ